MPERRNLRRALVRDDLHLHYQPIVDPRTHKAVSAEALLRGREDDRRELDIASVTAIAEQDTDIFTLERWVIEQACGDAARWRREGLEDLSLNLNFSAREFQNREFLPTLFGACSTAGLDPAHIILEITETAAIHEPSIAEKVVAELKARGYRIWLDDFGTGHSSLAWLKWFPVDGVKIPSSFVCDTVGDERCHIIVDGVVRMAKGLGILAIAEGIERADQLELMLEKQIDLIQGFFFYEPLGVDELLAALSTTGSTS